MNKITLGVPLFNIQVAQEGSHLVHNFVS